MLPMTRHKALHTGLVSPSPLDRWINAMLRVFAMLVSHVRSICPMRQTRPLAECHSETARKALPRKESGKLKETTQAATRSHRLGQLAHVAPRGQPPLGKGRSDLRNANRGGDHFVQWAWMERDPHPDFASRKSDLPQATKRNQP